MACCCASADERKDDNKALKDEITEGKVSITATSLANTTDEPSKKLNLDTEENQMKEIDNDGEEKVQPTSARGHRAMFL